MLTSVQHLCWLFQPLRAALRGSRLARETGPAIHLLVHICSSWKPTGLRKVNPVCWLTFITERSITIEASAAVADKMRGKRGGRRNKTNVSMCGGGQALARSLCDTPASQTHKVDQRDGEKSSNWKTAAGLTPEHTR